MKKIIPFLCLFLLSTLFISCSKDDDDINTNIIEHSASGTLTFKINNEEHAYSSLKVIEKRYADYTDLIVKGTHTNDTTKTISISLAKDDLGSQSIYYIQYVNNETFYQMTINDMTTDITESNASKITGTFSGQLSTINMDTLLVSEGLLNISY